MCVPMPSYMYDFMKMTWERTRDLMPSAARDIPPNHCSQQFYYSKFKGGLDKHRDVKKKKDGTSQFLPGSPIVTVTIAHPTLCYLKCMPQRTRTKRRPIQAMRLQTVTRT
jgi:hypothetical protein